METLLVQGQEVAQQMSWDVVAKDYLLPGILKTRDRYL